jgi:hypothetical protein
MNETAQTIPLGSRQRPRCVRGERANIDFVSVHIQALQRGHHNMFILRSSATCWRERY